MKKLRLRTILVFIAAGLCGALLLHTSQRVQQAEEEVARLEGKIESERESIRVLKAEWAYLNSPQRLEVLAQEYLGLEAPAPDSVVLDPAPLPPAPQMEPAAPLLHQIAQDGEVAPAETESEVIAVPPRKPDMPTRDFNALLERAQNGGAP